MIFFRKHVASLLALGATATTVVLFGYAQTQPPPTPIALPQTAGQPAAAMNHNVVVLDPAHGGPEPGAKLGDQLLEKDVTLALAARLRATLTAAGFTVVSTRDTDLPSPLTTDQRAEIANHAHAVACLVIHATGSGSGIHLYTSTLEPAAPYAQDDAGSRSAFEPTPWNLAQADSVQQSLRLQSDLSATLGTANLPALMGRAGVRPLDNLTCPAVAIEVSPLRVADGDATPVTDPGYQQRLADAMAKALQTWREHADPPAPAAEAIPADQTRAAAKATAAAEAAGIAAAKAHASGGTQ